MITRKDLLEWLKKIDKKLTRKIIIIAIGNVKQTKSNAFLSFTFPRKAIINIPIKVR